MKWRDYKVKKLDLGEKGYPKLYYRGNLKVLEKQSIAVVGSRLMTRYGREVTEKFVSYLVSQGIVIVSGFMYGVDTQAHCAAIEYGGETIAVFGSGLDEIYPSENEELYTRILQKGGLVISEYGLTAKPQLWTYPRRNRIVVELSKFGVLVVEAGMKSGSLITARIAKKMGKQVWAIPGPITSSTSAGTNFLIKNGDGQIVLNPEEILGKRVQNIEQSGEGTEMGEIERKLLCELKREALTVDELAKILEIDVVELGQKLTMMSLKGVVNEVGGKYYLS